jgi:hypothetical protein
VTIQITRQGTTPEPKAALNVLGKWAMARRTQRCARAGERGLSAAIVYELGWLGIDVSWHQ